MQKCTLIEIAKVRKKIELKVLRKKNMYKSAVICHFIRNFAL